MGDGREGARREEGSQRSFFTFVCVALLQIELFLERSVGPMLPQLLVLRQLFRIQEADRRLDQHG